MEETGKTSGSGPDRSNPDYLTERVPDDPLSGRVSSFPRDLSWWEEDEKKVKEEKERGRLLLGPRKSRLLFSYSR